MSREAMKLALEALETHVPHVYKDRGYAPIIALKQALEQPEPEPVAWMTITPYGEEDDIWYENPEGKLLDDWTYKPLYTTPPKAQPEQKYRRGDRLVCLETDEYCVIHIAGTNRQWVKFPDTHIGVYTNEQLDQLFEKLTKEQDAEQPEPEPVAHIPTMDDAIVAGDSVLMNEQAALLRESEPPSWTPVEIGVDVTPEGAHVVGMYVLMPEAVRYVFYSQFHSAPKRKPLTHEEIDALLIEHGVMNQWPTQKQVHKFARAIEAKLKEKNT